MVGKSLSDPMIMPTRGVEVASPIVHKIPLKRGGGKLN
jgi:hypothetical protein